MAFGYCGISLVGSTGLGSHHTAAKPRSKTDMCHIAVGDLRKLLRIWICQVQVASKYRNIHLIFRKYIFHIHGKSRGQCLIGSGKLSDHLTGCQMSADKAKLMDIGNTFLKRKLFRIM